MGSTLGVNEAIQGIYQVCSVRYVVLVFLYARFSSVRYVQYMLYIRHIISTYICIYIYIYTCIRYIYICYGPRNPCYGFACFHLLPPYEIFPFPPSVAGSAPPLNPLGGWRDGGWDHIIYMYIYIQTYHILDILCKFDCEWKGLQALMWGSWQFSSVKPGMVG